MGLESEVGGGGCGRWIDDKEAGLMLSTNLGGLEV